MWLLPVMRDSITRFDRDMDRGYHRITLNMPYAEVCRMMKSDGVRSQEFRLAQSAGYEIEYAAANKSGAKYFVMWRNGIDWTYTVGFDANDCAVYKAKGTS